MKLNSIGPISTSTARVNIINKLNTAPAQTFFVGKYDEFYPVQLPYKVPPMRPVLHEIPICVATRNRKVDFCV